MRLQRTRARLACAGAVIAAGSALVAGATPAAGAAAAGAAATTCKLTLNQERHSGPTYLNTLTVSGGPSCAAGVALVTAYYKCRVAGGGVKGLCTKPVLGYHCSEAPRMTIPTEFIALVTCTKGSARVVHRYTQFT